MTVPLILSILRLIVIDKMRKTTRIGSEHLTNLSHTLECPSEGWQKTRRGSNVTIPYGIMRKLTCSILSSSS